MRTNCINACPCRHCMKTKASLQFNIKIDPSAYPQEYEIAKILKKQRSFNRVFREFLREYALSVYEQVNNPPGDAQPDIQQ
jgi:hypothetical protein